MSKSIRKGVRLLTLFSVLCLGFSCNTHSGGDVAWIQGYWKGSNNLIQIDSDYIRVGDYSVDLKLGLSNIDNALGEAQPYSVINNEIIAVNGEPTYWIDNKNKSLYPIISSGEVWFESYLEEDIDKWTGIWMPYSIFNPVPVVLVISKGIEYLQYDFNEEEESLEDAIERFSENAEDDYGNADNFLAACTPLKDYTKLEDYIIIRDNGVGNPLNYIVLKMVEAAESEDEEDDEQFYDVQYYSRYDNMVYSKISLDNTTASSNNEDISWVQGTWSGYMGEALNVLLDITPEEVRLYSGFEMMDSFCEFLEDVGFDMSIIENDSSGEYIMENGICYPYSIKGDYLIPSCYIDGSKTIPGQTPAIRFDSASQSLFYGEMVHPDSFEQLKRNTKEAAVFESYLRFGQEMTMMSEDKKTILFFYPDEENKTEGTVIDCLYHSSTNQYQPRYYWNYMVADKSLIRKGTVYNAQSRITAGNVSDVDFNISLLYYPEKRVLNMAYRTDTLYQVRTSDSFREKLKNYIDNGIIEENGVQKRASDYYIVPKTDSNSPRQQAWNQWHELAREVQRLDGQIMSTIDPALRQQLMSQREALNYQAEQFRNFYFSR